MAGVTAVFAADFTQLNAGVAKADESLGKFEQAGVNAQAQLNRLTDATNGVTASTFDWKTALVSVAGVFGVAFSLNAVKNWAVGVVSAASQVGDLSVKLGASTEAVQRWKYAADLGGTSIETVDRAVQNMNRTLGAGGQGTVDILKKAGLSFGEIRNMRSEDAFNAITGSVGRIEDPMTRAAVATALFGKAGQEMLPAMIAGFAKVAEGAEVMSADTIARLKEAEDAWTRLSHHVTISSGEFLANVHRIHTSWSEFGISLLPTLAQEYFRMLADDTNAFAGSLTKVPPVALDVGRGLRSVALDADGTKEAIRALEATTDKNLATMKKITDAQEELAIAGEGWRKTIVAIDPELRKNIETYVAMSAPVGAIATALGTTAHVVNAVTNAFKEQQAAMFAADVALVDHTKNIAESLIRTGGVVAEQSAKQLKNTQAMIALAAQLDAAFKPEGPSARDVLSDQVAGLEAMRRIWSDAFVNEKLNQLYELYYQGQGAAGNMPGTSYAPPATYTGPTTAPSGSAPPVTNNFNITQPLGTPEQIADAIDAALQFRSSASGARH